MSLVYTNIVLAFIISLMGVPMYRSHLMSLLCLEGMMLSLFIMLIITILNTHFTLASTVPIILLVFAACEAALGLSLPVLVPHTHGTDYAQTLNFSNVKTIYSQLY